MEVVTLQPNEQQLAAIRNFARIYGRRWKEHLNDFWCSGRDEREEDAALLRQLRNDFGPSWLAEFNL